ncbi:MAG: hypothetical protein ACLQBB_11050 [Solirubrobacteraceae bacterium]
MTRAIEVTEDALGQVARIAVEEIHCGLEASSHIEAAERDMRSALRQLVLAERELRSRSGFAPGLEELEERKESIGEVVPGPGATPGAVTRAT